MHVVQRHCVQFSHDHPLDGQKREEGEGEEGGGMSWILETEALLFPDSMTFPPPLKERQNAIGEKKKLF